MTERTFTWPGWEIGPTLGKGGFGKVVQIHRAIPGGQETAALKIISIPGNEDEIIQMRADGYTDESITAHFREHKEDILREYVMMTQMRGCANIVHCQDFRAIQHDDGIGWDIYIKMELLTPLMTYLGGTVAEAQVRRLGMDIGNALSYCDKYNIIHRDIKPANIFAAGDGSFKLGDFGIARTLERTSGATRIGTEGYMAPEVYRGQPYGARADIYSLGLVLYELMNGFRRPFEPDASQPLTVHAREDARTRRFRGDPLPPPAYGSPALQQVVLRACAFDPRERFATAGELVAALADPSAYLQAQTRPEPKPVLRQVPARKSIAAPVLFGVIACAALIFFLGFLLPTLTNREEVIRGHSDSRTDPDHGIVIVSPGEGGDTRSSTEAVEETQPPRPVLRNVVGSGREHTAILHPNGTASAVGKSEQGQTLVDGWTNIISISAGDYHTIGLRADGTVAAAGYNYNGQISVSTWRNIVAVSAGDYHTIGLTASGQLVATGRNTEGQCDMNTLMNYAGTKEIVNVAAGFRHSAALLADGTVVAVGSNEFGQCNVSGWDNVVELHTGSDHTVALRADGTVVATGDNQHGQCNVGHWTDIVAISAGDYFTMGLKSDGTVVAVGENTDGQTNVGGWTDVVAIGGGSKHSIGLRADGTILSTGSNTFNQCGMYYWS